MDLLDKVLLEWSARTEKGYPDLNNEQDLAIFESMFGFELNEQEEEKNINIDTIISLLNSKKDALPQDFLNKIYKQINSKGKKITTQLVDIIKKKNLGFAKAEILTNAQLLSEEDSLFTFLIKKKGISPQDFIKSSGGNLTTFLSDETGLSSELVNKLVNIKTVDEQSKGVGEGEVALALFLEDGVKAKIGDVKSLSYNFEVKGTESRLGERSTGSANLEDIYSGIENISGIKPRRGGKEAIHSYIAYLVSTEPNSTDEIRKYLNGKFDGYFINTDLQDQYDVRKTLFRRYVDLFFKSTEGSQITHMVFIVNGSHYVYNKEEFKQAVTNGTITTTNFTKSTSTPQLTGLSE